MLLKDSDNGEQIVLKRKKDIFKKIVSWKKKNLRLEEIIRYAVLKLEESVRKGKKRK